MSFGFSIGDFISVIELARKVWKGFADAPEQLRVITQEHVSPHMGLPLLIDTRVRSLSIILDDVEFGASRCCLGARQEESLGSLLVACREVLEDLEKTLDKYGELGSKTRSLSGRVKRNWKRLTLEPDDIRLLRSRITSNIAMLNTCLQGMSR